MGSKPEVAVLRRFRKLNVLRLLEMQSDLVQQERHYANICSQDAKVDCSTSRSYMKDWSVLNESRGLGSTHQRAAWRKLRDGLEAYSQTQRRYQDSQMTSYRSNGKTMRYYNKYKFVTKMDQASMIWGYYNIG